MTGDDIGESTLLAGPDVRVFERPIPNGTLRLGLYGGFKFDTDKYVDDLTRVIAAQRAFWADVFGPYTVTLYALQGIATGSSAGGTGRSDGFALEATPDIDLPNLTRILAHEHTHSWIPRRVGELPKEDEALSYWFSEGVTDFYTGRTLIGTGIWTPSQFVDDLNEALARYAGSPAHDLPNTAIGERFWTDDDVQQLPYDRGRLFAFLIDSRLRAASGGTANYDDLLTIMRDRWRAAPVGAKPQLRPALLAAAAQLDLDAVPLLERYVDRGEPILLPADLFGPCAVVRTVRLTAFEPSFDRAKSSESGGDPGRGPGQPCGARRVAQRYEAARLCQQQGGGLARTDGVPDLGCFWGAYHQLAARRRPDVHGSGGDAGGYGRRWSMRPGVRWRQEIISGCGVSTSTKKRDRGAGIIMDGH